MNNQESDVQSVTEVATTELAALMLRLIEADDKAQKAGYMELALVIQQLQVSTLEGVRSSAGIMDELESLLFDI